MAEAAGVRGTILLAAEGVNGTVAGSAVGIEATLAALRALPGCGDLQPKISHAAEQPFRRLKVRVKAEIVTRGQPGVDARTTGTKVPAAGWNAVVSDPDTVVIDTRNDYETAIGTFRGAVDPGTQGFRDFPNWWADNADRFAGKRIAMFCTGGIRCEKASAWVQAQGVPEVLQLDGGILKYLEEVPAEHSLWQGACFVFDGRTAVEHGLAEGAHRPCHACGRAVRPEDTGHPDYRPGVSCPACIDEYSDADRERFAERERQTALAKARAARRQAG